MGRAANSKKKWAADPEWLSDEREQQFCPVAQRTSTPTSPDPSPSHKRSESEDEAPTSFLVAMFSCREVAHSNQELVSLDKPPSLEHGCYIIESGENTAQASTGEQEEQNSKTQPSVTGKVEGQVSKASGPSQKPKRQPTKRGGTN